MGRIEVIPREAKSGSRIFLYFLLQQWQVAYADLEKDFKVRFINLPFAQIHYFTLHADSYFSSYEKITC